MAELIVRRFDETNKDKQIAYEVNGHNYSELLIKAFLEEYLPLFQDGPAYQADGD